MNISTKGIKKDGLPDGFVYIDELIEDCIIDAKYWGTDNLVGRPLNGYEQPLVIMCQKVADCCVKAANILREQGYLMKIFDAYRPQRAVDDLVKWGADLEDIRRKTINYPNVEKAEFFKVGYISTKSGHTRACAVDLTLVDKNTWHELDMGTLYDFMDVRSHVITDAITELQEQNRQILRKAMTDSGFITYACEWWHFNLSPEDEPYPDTYFDFPIK